MSYWKYISYLGIDSESVENNDKGLILSNKINVIIFFIMLVVFTISAIENNINNKPIGFNTYKIIVIAIFCLFNIFLASRKLIQFSKILTSVVPAFMFILVPAIFGYVQEEDFIYSTYVAIAISVIPQLLFSAKKEKFSFWFSIVYFIVIISLYDIILLNLPEEQYQILTLIKKFVVYYIAAHVLVFLFVNLVIIYLKNINHRYEQKFKNQNSELKKIRDSLYNNNIKLTETVDKLQKAQLQLIQSEQMASLGILMAGITHELNNPLNFISVGIQNIDYNFSVLHDLLSKNDLTNDKKVKSEYDNTVSILSQSVEVIKTGVARIEEIFNGLKTFTQTNKGKCILSNIHDGIDATLMLLQSNLKDKIEIEKIYDNKIKSIYCFNSELNQVYMNILKNSIYAIKDKGKITITTSLIDKNEANKYKLEDNYIQISIKDTGCGISDKITDNIFLPFFTTKEVGEGIGLGLSLSYGIIKKHKGKIIVNSQVNKGSEFILFINTELSPQ